jgi:hypothetical protein
VTLKLKHLPALFGLVAALLVLPSAAFADGTFEFQSDQSHVVVHSKTMDNKGAYYMLFTFPQDVTQATFAGGVCATNFRGNPRLVDCPVPAGPTGTQPSSFEMMAVVAQPMACSDKIVHESSIDNNTYRADGEIVNSPGCPPPPPPPDPGPPPPPDPEPGPNPDEQPAGGSVSQAKYPIITGAGAGGGPHVRVFNPMSDSPFFAFDAFAPSFQGGVRVAQGDVNGDGVVDLITAAGAGGGPHVKVFDGNGGDLLMSFFAFDPGFQGGVFVAAGDVNGDGRAEIITAAGAGGGPHVKIFDGATGAPTRDFAAFAESFQGGVTVAAGDVNGDGRPDIIAGAGPGGGPQVRVFDGRTGSQIKSFFAEPAGFTGGVFVGSSNYTPPPVNIGTLPVSAVGDVVIGVPCSSTCSGLIGMLLPAVQKIRNKAQGGSAAAKAKKPVLIGSKKFTGKAGQTVKVKVRLSKKGRKAIGNAKKVKAFARIVVRDAAGNLSTRQLPVVLKFRR